jgi:two-component system osmolarity sensor histidine kinase EnvZ
MTRLFDRLVFRTAGLFTLLFVVSQASWVVVGSLFLFKPRPLVPPPLPPGLLMLPMRRLPFPSPMLGSLLTAVIVSGIGAYLLISRLNRRLQVVVEASRTIGRGEIPAPIAVAGPLEIQQLSRCFNQMSEDLQRLDAERRLMLAGISHDIRTPLVRLRLGVELGRPELNPDAAESMIREIEEIDAILSQFLQFACDESQEPIQLMDMDSLVSDVCLGYRRRGRAIRTVLGSVGVASAREVAIRRLLANLIDNAIRYGEKDVEVTTSRLGDNILLTVSDRGPGIKSMAPEELLRPFAREDTSRSKPGTGLGLTIVDRIARVHGGSVTLRNRSGGGLAVLVSLAT